MNILITGIHGFVGKNLVNFLKSEHAIHGLDIASQIKDGVVKTYEWNELDQIPPMDCIIHLAGKAHDTKNTSSEKDYFDINLGLTQKIFDYFLQSSASKFIFFSSVKAVADEIKGEMLTEEANPKPKTPYGESKLAAERDILSRKSEVGRLKTEEESFQIADSGPRTSDKKIYILRPCMIHGPGNKGNLNLLYTVVKKGIPWPLGAYENKRSMVSIDNLGWVIQQIVEKDIEPGIYQVADDEPLSTNEIIELISESIYHKPHIWRLNKSLVKSIAKAGDVLHLPLNSERLKKLTESYVVSNAKLKKGLGVEKMPVEAKEGLKKTLESFKKL